MHMRVMVVYLQAALTILCTRSSANAQGSVNFGNASSLGCWMDPSLDRYVHWAPSAALFDPRLVPGELVTSNYAGINFSSLRAALYYAASTETDLGQFVAASGGPSGFKNSTSANAGSWFGHLDTLDTIPNGVTANLTVLVWDSNLSNDPLSTAARAGLWGSSSIFQYTPPTDALPGPWQFMMDGLTAFQVGFPAPETSSWSLFGLGLIVYLCFRRIRKRPASSPNPINTPMNRCVNER